ncbi:MAG TPA: AI-2E family transporter, partial [Pyrinomonadaceae bacterium]
NQITDFAKRAPTLQTTAQGRVQGLTGFCTRNEIPDNVCKAINGTLTSAIDVTKNYVTTDLPGLVVAVLGFIPWMILIPIMSFFLLKDVDSFRRSALQMLPRGRWRWRGDEFFQDVNSTLAAYIRAQLTACVLIGTICTIGFLIIGVPYALLLGILAGFLEFIPLVGPLVVVVVAALIASFNSVYDALWVILFLAVLRVIHDYAVYPRIIGQGIHLHPLAVILAILCGAELAGVAGIFLAIPVIAIATVSYRHWLEHKGSEGIVADILKPVETTPAAAAPPVAESRPPAPLHATPPDHPARDTTPEEMARARPDLTTGELKMPKLET